MGENRPAPDAGHSRITAFGHQLSSFGRIARTGVLVCLAAGFLAACGSTPEPVKKAKFSPKKYGVKGSPKVVAAGKPVPKGGGRYVVGKKYKIAGKWYYPKHEPNYKKVGLASWYGPTFHGRKTANGEIFDRNGLTAAHTTMPLPSYAKVTNMANGRSMIVRVNDRGPFHGNRVIDLSERVATMLGTKDKGVGKVKVEYVGKARIDGQDEQYLLASYSGPGAVQPGATRPGTLFAKLTPPVVDTFTFGPAPAPAPRPYEAPTAVAAVQSSPQFRVAYDPALAFEAGPQTVQVASLNTFDSGTSAQPVPQAAAPVPAVAYTPPAPTGSAQPASGTPGLFKLPAAFRQPGPRDLLAGGAISSYRANDRIDGAYEALSVMPDNGKSLRLLALSVNRSSD